MGLKRKKFPALVMCPEFEWMINAVPKHGTKFAIKIVSEFGSTSRNDKKMSPRPIAANNSLRLPFPPPFHKPPTTFVASKAPNKSSHIL